MSGKDAESFENDLRLMSRAFHLELDWGRLREREVTFWRSNKDDQREKITRPCKEWDDFFYKEEPIIAVASERTYFIFETAKGRYWLHHDNEMAGELYNEMLRAQTLAVQRKLSGHISWYYLGSDLSLDDPVAWWIFFLADGEEIIDERVAVNNVGRRLHDYFKFPDTDWHASDAHFESARTKEMYVKFYRETQFGRLWWRAKEQGFVSCEPEQEALVLLQNISGQISSLRGIAIWGLWILSALTITMLFR